MRRNAILNSDKNKQVGREGLGEKGEKNERAGAKEGNPGGMRGEMCEGQHT